jgi:hypothetical protein
MFRAPPPAKPLLEILKNKVPYEHIYIIYKQSYIFYNYVYSAKKDSTM